MRIPRLRRVTRTGVATLYSVSPGHHSVLTTHLNVPPRHYFSSCGSLVTYRRISTISVYAPGGIRIRVTLTTVGTNGPFTIRGPVTIATRRTEMLHSTRTTTGIPSVVYFSCHFGGTTHGTHRVIRSNGLNAVHRICIECLRT